MCGWPRASKSLATNSSQLTQEIRENRALAPNTLFSEFATNRVQLSIFASRTGFLGLDASKDKTAEAMLATDGTNIFALCHVDDTPLVLWDPGHRLERSHWHVHRSCHRGSGASYVVSSA